MTTWLQVLALITDAMTELAELSRRLVLAGLSLNELRDRVARVMAVVAHLQELTERYVDSSEIDRELSLERERPPGTPGDDELPF